jgi:uncharacterized protein YbjT (DUF2867 family)
MHQHPCSNTRFNHAPEATADLVFGATGQQGGSVATSLLKAGWSVRAFVRDPASPKAAGLKSAGAELVRVTFSDEASMRSAMAGAYGVFSVQPSSGQGPVLGISDEDEERYGVTIAKPGARRRRSPSRLHVGRRARGRADGHAAFRYQASHREAYPQLAAHGDDRPTGRVHGHAGHAGFGLDRGVFTSFAQPNQPVQFLAVEDIGRFVASIFADPERFGGTTVGIASDVVTGHDLEAAFTQAAGRPITYMRFPDDVLARNPFLAKLTDLFDSGRLAVTQTSRPCAR